MGAGRVPFPFQDEIPTPIADIIKINLPSLVLCETVIKAIVILLLWMDDGLAPLRLVMLLLLVACVLLSERAFAQGYSVRNISTFTWLRAGKGGAPLLKRLRVVGGSSVHV